MSSDENSENNNNTKKINFTTDYMPELLENSDKLVAKHKRVKTTKNNYNSDNSSEDVNDYVTKSDDEPSKHYSESHEDNYSNNNSNKVINEDEEEDNYNYLTKQQKRQRRMTIMAQLGELSKIHGIKLSKSYNIDSDYFEMKNEYDLHKRIRDKEKTITWLSGVLFSCIEGIEMWSEESGAENYNIRLSGWKDRMNANIEDYYEVFGELYEKYNKYAKGFEPEIKLLFLIIGSATMTQLRNTRKKPTISTDEIDGYTKLKNKFNKEHDKTNNDLNDFDMLKKARERQNEKELELQRMKEQFERTERENNEKNDETRYKDINDHLHNLRNNLTKINTSKEQYPDYKQNVMNKIDTDSSNKEETKKSSYSRKSKKKLNPLTVNI
jgi:Family of unknown function (DUF5767)